MEFLDVVNDKDEVIGKASQKEVYDKNLNHRIVHVLIFNSKGEMALHLRSRHKSFCPQHWSTPVGGHVQSGESYEEAALRESEEELDIKPELKFFYKDIYNANRIKKFLVTFRAVFDGPFMVNPLEVEKVEFFNLGKIQEMINSGEKFHPELLFLLKKHFGINKIVK
ncbi:MAG: NUDIX domain-containing protein [Candidatus Aenigmarchaeota archaeon]|nr:NUDIX domain-containing protein [Candidatus Aenigmarchaeota archaeon]